MPDSQLASASGLRILLLEDDSALSAPLRRQLMACGYAVTIAPFEEIASPAAREPSIACIIAGLSRSSPNSVATIERARASWRWPPLFLLLPAMSENDICLYLSAGVTDCLPRTTAIRVIAEKVRAIVELSATLHTISCFGGKLLLDRFRRRLSGTVGGKAKSLRIGQQECDVIALLAAAAEELVPGALIDGCVWGRDMAGDENRRHRLVGRVRRHIRQVSTDVELETVHGIGYRLASARCKVPPPSTTQVRS